MAHLSGGVLGLLLLAAIVWAIVNVAQSQASPGAKALWIVLLLVLPVIGLVIWLIAGPPGALEQIGVDGNRRRRSHQPRESALL